MKTKTMVKHLPTSDDFDELLNLSTLQTQMEVLSKLQANMLTYQRNYMKSFLMTSSEILEYIPEENHKDYEVRIFGGPSGHLDLKMNDIKFKESLDKFIICHNTKLQCKTKIKHQY